MMRIAISAGHNVFINNNFDCGALGNGKRESDITKETVKYLIPLLKTQGHEVIDVTPYDEKFKEKKDHHILRCKRVDEFNADLYLDIHVNAGGGTGVECWVYSKKSKSYPYAVDICKSISNKMGFANRGVKEKPTYWSVSLCRAPAIIVEGAFIDNESDMKKLTPEKYATAIAEIFGEVEKDINKLYRVQVGAFSIRENAERLLNELKEKGFNGFINEVDVEVEKEPIKEKDPIANTKKSKYYKIGDTHIIETTPDNIEIKVLGDTLHGASVYGINGTFFDTKTAPVTSPNSCVFIAMNGGKPISNNAQFNGWNAPPRATMIYHKNGLMGFRKLQNINTIRDNTIWAIGGYMVKPYMDFKNEKMPSSINYKTAHTYIGYDEEGNIYLIVKPNHMIYEIVPLLNDLGITNAIVLDGGGSSQLNHPNGNFRSSRKINTAILLKEV